MVDIMFGVCLEHSDHEMIEFLIVREVRRPESAKLPPGASSGQTGFSLFQRLLDRVPWKAVLRGHTIQECWTLFEREVLKT